MGKSYALELEQLAATYGWAASTDIGQLTRAVSEAAILPLLAVGSGGSLSAAHHASSLHQEHTGFLAKAVTPLELLRSSLYLGVHSVLLLSAGGTNSDIIAALRNVIEREPRRCTVLCFRPGSPLSQLAKRYEFVDLVEMSPPSRRDVFLSTNSLVSFAVLLERAYADALAKREGLAGTLDAILPAGPPLERLLIRFREECRPLWKRSTVLVLYGPALQSAAVDLESKFSEAALGNVQVADLRNFAHGRHNWLAKRAATSGVLALFSQADRELADTTLRLLPRDVVVARVELPATGAPARVAALVTQLHLVGDAGKAREIDPGRPQVPAFGQRIYHIRASATSRSRRVPHEAGAIARKVGADPYSLASQPGLVGWRRAYRHFLQRLGKATFGAILFDYDGTLCEPRSRFTGIRKEVVAVLRRFMSAQVPIGIATGRGKSVREDLRKALPKKTWDMVSMGYYNCTDIAQLTDDNRPIAAGISHPSLGAAARALSENPTIAFLATTEIRPGQVSLQVASPSACEQVWRVALDIIQQSFGDLKIVRSSHSVDVLTQGASKKALLEVLDEVTAPKLVLSIGDMGRWPGNDHAILATPYSLSVDEVSTAPDSCWHLAPVGYRGVQATLHYAHAIIVRRGSFRIDTRKLAPMPTPRDHR